jgi:hypothetical protein
MLGASCSACVTAATIAIATPGCWSNDCEAHNWTADYELHGDAGVPDDTACVVTITGSRATGTYRFPALSELQGCKSVIGCPDRQIPDSTNYPNTYCVTLSGPAIGCSRYWRTDTDHIFLSMIGLGPPTALFGDDTVLVEVACDGKPVASNRIGSNCVHGA